MMGVQGIHGVRNGRGRFGSALRSGGNSYDRPTDFVAAVRGLAVQ